MPQGRKRLRREQFDNIMFGRKRIDELVGWQLREAFQILREIFFRSQAIIRQSDADSNFRILREVLWTAQFVLWIQYRTVEPELPRVTVKI